MRPGGPVLLTALTAAAAVALGGSGCTSISMARLPPAPADARPIRVTTGTLAEPYQSLGLIQIHRRAQLLFGWVSVPHTDLQVVFEEILLPEAERRGADAIIGVRFHEELWSPAARTLFMCIPIFGWFLPYTSVTITGELVKRVPPAPAPPPLP